MRQSQVFLHESGSLMHLYHFVANALGRKSVQDIITAHEAQILQALRQVVCNSKVVQIGLIVVFLSSNKEKIISLPTVKISETQLQNIVQIGNSYKDGTLIFQVSEDIDFYKKIASCIIEANLVINPDLTGDDLIISLASSPKSSHCTGLWYDVLTEYGPATYIDIKYKLCGYETDFTPSMHESPPLACPCCGFGD
jgi:hypothetical protein